MHQQTPATDAMPISTNHNLTFIQGDFATSAKGDAINALVSLGYKQVQAEKSIKSIYQTDMSSEDLIRDALKSML